MTDSSKDDDKSWYNLKKLVAPATGFSTGKIDRKVDPWVVEQRLKANYYLDDGVSKWHMVYPLADKGQRQSPIDICTNTISLDPKLKPLKPRYENQCCENIINTGNGWKVDVDDSKTALTGGALENEFKLIQFHAHWGTPAGAKGSEHTIDGKLYSAELHLVHWNTKYGLFTKAVNEPDGLAVIGIMMDVTESEDHPEMEKLISHFQHIEYKGMETKLTKCVDPLKFLPENLSYWHYPGSLTTPPLNESVLWHVLQTPIQISKRQLRMMASLQTGEEKEDRLFRHCIVNNFRPPQPLGPSRIVTSFCCS